MNVKILTPYFDKSKDKSIPIGEIIEVDEKRLEEISNIGVKSEIIKNEVIEVARPKRTTRKPKEK